MVKVLKIALLYSIYIFAFITLICIINILRITIPMSFDWSTKGFEFLFNQFGVYKDIFTLSFTITGIYLVVEQIEIASFANKISSRSEWRSNLETKLQLIKNPAIKDHVEAKSNEMFDFIIENNYRISNKNDLKTFFNLFLDSKIMDFEQGSVDFNINKEYQSNDQSYSFEQFLLIKNYLIEASVSYVDFSKDFKELYFKRVKEFNRDKIKK
jgi:hypothetical protein